MEVQWERDEQEKEEEEVLMRRRRLPDKISSGYIINDVINGTVIHTTSQEQQNGKNSNYELSVPENGKSEDELSVNKNDKSEDEFSDPGNGESNREPFVLEIGESNRERFVPEIGESNRERVFPEIGESNRERVLPEIGEANHELIVLETGRSNRKLIVPEIGQTNRERVLPEIGEANNEIIVLEIGETNRMLILPEIGETNRERVLPENDNGHNSDNDKNGHVQSVIVNDQYQQNSKDDILVKIKTLPAEKPVKNPDIAQSSSEITENGADVDKLKEKGLNDPDVERVIKEQNTHDLFCPNCNSCITRRVVLRKRKRGLKISEEDGKRKHSEIVDAISEKTTDNQSNNIVNTSIVDSSSQTPASAENNRDTDPEVFRCLSCFTFFIPKGNGFKLFGDKKEKENLQSEQTLSVKKNWFSFLFSSRTEEMLISKDVVENSDAVSRPEINSSSSLLVVNSSEGGPRVTEEVVGNVGKRTHGGEKEKTVPSHAEISEEKAKEESDLGKSQLNQKPNTTIENKGTEYKDWLFPGKNSVNGKPDNNKKVDVVADFPSQNGQNLEVKPSMPIHSTVQVQNVDITYSDSSYSNGVAHNNNVGTKVDIHIEKTQMDNADNPSLTTPLLLHDTEVSNIIKDLVGLPTSTGGDTIINIATENPVQAITSQQVQDIIASGGTEFSTLAERESRGVEVIKSIVYGGLVETITSLGVVSSAAGSEIAIINIVALGLANLFSGLFVLCHSLWDLKNDDYGLVSGQMTENAPNQRTQRIDKYKDLLGRRENFYLHAFVAILSYIVFGSLPPVVYGFSFQQSNDRYYKLIAVAAASFLCIAVLSLAKAFVQRPPKPYVKTVFNYVALGFMASGVSYVAGNLIQKLIEKLGWLNTVADLSVPIMRKSPVQTGWSYY